METKIILIDQIRFGKRKVSADVISKHTSVFQGYREKWKTYNIAKKLGKQYQTPLFPCTIRVYEQADGYVPIDDNTLALLRAAQEVKINKIVVVIEKPIGNQDDSVVSGEPIHANRFFDDFKEALQCLQATDRQRVEFFKPLFRAMSNEGFTDAACRFEFLEWARKEIERYPIRQTEPLHIKAEMASPTDNIQGKKKNDDIDQ